MKNIKFIFAVLTLVLISSCSSEDDGANNTNSNPTSEGYTYEIKKILGSKVQVYSQATTAKLFTLKNRSYAIDTLEIDLNANPNLQLAIKIEIAQNVDIVTPASDNIMSHVNYINFINLRPQWDDNVYDKVFLETRYSSQPKKFTYSDSNLDISLHPELFISNPNNNTFENLEIRPAIGLELETINSNTNYNVGEEIIYNGIKYKVISKIEL